MHRLTGEWLTDASCASGTGLMDIARGDWDRDALELAQIDAERLAPIVPVTHRLALHRDRAGSARRHACGDRRRRRSPGQPRPRRGIARHGGMLDRHQRRAAPDRAPAGVDPAGQLFCYALIPDRWILGGAISNGGSVLAWLGATLAPELGEDSSEALLRARRRGPGRQRGPDHAPLPARRARPTLEQPGPRRLRRPAPVARPRAHGPRRDRGRLPAARARARLAHRGRPRGDECGRRAALPETRWWRQLLADVLGVEIGYCAGPQGSALGAALIGRLALGHIDSVAHAGELVSVTSATSPIPTRPPSTLRCARCSPPSTTTSPPPFAPCRGGSREQRTDRDRVRRPQPAAARAALRR